jgi:hypothetical protein
MLLTVRCDSRLSHRRDLLDKWPNTYSAVVRVEQKAILESQFTHKYCNYGIMELWRIDFRQERARTSLGRPSAESFSSAGVVVPPDYETHHRDGFQHVISWKSWMKRLAVMVSLTVLSSSLRAQTPTAILYVSQAGDNTVGSVSQINAITGAVINGNFIRGLDFPYGLALSGNNLYVADYGTQTVGQYNATTGAVIKASFITGLHGPTALAVSGNNLYVANEGGTVGQYNATTGAAINANLITGLVSAWGLAVSGDFLFVADEVGGTVGKYYTSGAVINDIFISLAYPQGLAVSDGTLFVSDGILYDGVLQYNATTGASLGYAITGLDSPIGLAVWGNKLFVANNKDATVGEYYTSGAVFVANFVRGGYPYALAVTAATPTPTPTPAPTPTPTPTPDPTARLYVNQVGNKSIGVYDANTGAVKTANFITGLTQVSQFLTKKEKVKDFWL